MALRRRLNFGAAMMVALVVGFGFIALPGVAKAENWMLMGREGDCVTLAQAGQRKSEFLGITGPEDLARRLRSAGHDVTLQDMGTTKDRVVAVEAPGAGISVILAPEHFCRK